MKWNEFFNEIEDREDDEILRDAVLLTDLGDPEEILEVANQLLLDKPASRFMNRVMDMGGVDFSFEQYLDFAKLLDAETLARLLRESKYEFTPGELEKFDWALKKKDYKALLEKIKSTPPSADALRRELEIMKEKKRSDFWYDVGFIAGLSDD
ncbi:MAG: hypothetical protein LBM60_09145 [Clostridium sp.]|jgi:hypothetical protein|nr:hypothetical protein [Clostridium sp.]